MNYEKYREIMRKIADVNYASAVLNWDQETYMPPKGAIFRGEQLATLAGIAHDFSTGDELGSLLEMLSTDKTLTETEKKNIQRSSKDYKDRKKYTTDFVQSMSRTISECFNAWQTAKQTNDFNLYAPSLEKLVRLKREECKILGYKDHPYDAMIDQYEPGTKTADLDVLFKNVRMELSDFIKQVGQQKQNEEKFMFLHYDKDKQWNFGIGLLKQMGYDFEAGRQDLSSHPFTTSFSSQDVRVTTRISENDINEMIWSCIHEGGHALYEQGLNPGDYGLPSGESISLGIHESQSRLWENNVGRSLPYWKANYPALQKLFPENLKEVSLEAFYKAMNIVKPSLIRTGADELTYHFHILIRFEIEKALIEGSIEVADLPAYWNKKYKEYLGIDVPSDTEGVLQDVHWSHGSFGYFPTYSLGSFYAAQFFAKAQEEIKNFEQEMESGNVVPLLTWLKENIHKHGRYYTAEELCVKITGEKLNFSYFMEYAKKKYGFIYSLRNFHYNLSA